MTSTAARNRSYSAEAARPVGSTATFTEDVAVRIPDATFETWTPVTIAAGEPVTIRGYSNAGFRGIEVSVLTRDGHRVHGVSAGLLSL